VEALCHLLDDDDGEEHQRDGHFAEGEQHRDRRENTCDEDEGKQQRRQLQRAPLREYPARERIGTFSGMARWVNMSSSR